MVFKSVVNLVSRTCDQCSTIIRRSFGIERNNANGDENLPAIINPRDFLAAAQANEEAVVERNPDQPDADLPVVQEVAHVEDMDTRMDRYYKEQLKPLIHCESMASYVLFIYDELKWCVLVRRKNIRREYLSGLRKHGALADSSLTELRLQWTTSFGTLNLPKRRIRSFLLQLGETLSAFKKLKSLRIHLNYHSNTLCIDRAIARMLKKVQHISDVTFECDRPDRELEPVLVLQALASLPCLKTFYFKINHRRWVSLVCHVMKTSRTLQKFIVLRSLPTYVWLTELEVDAFTELLKTCTLTDFSLSLMRFRDGNFLHSFAEALAMSKHLSKLLIRQIKIDANTSAFYSALVARLPVMKNLQTFTINMGFE
jgi:hypothetical protein